MRMYLGTICTTKIKSKKEKKKNNIKINPEKLYPSVVSPCRKYKEHCKQTGPAAAAVVICPLALWGAGRGPCLPCKTSCGAELPWRDRIPLPRTVGAHWEGSRERRLPE